MTQKATPWATLSAINVNDKIEKKNGMSYLSWAWAWGVLKEHFPEAWFTKHENDKGYPYFMDVQGFAFVKVTVGLDRSGNHDVTEMLPILDHRNKPIPGPTSFDVNNALQRCLTKAIAYHGLGHYIYAGEDMPQDAAGEPPEGINASRGTQMAKNASAPVAASGGAAGEVPIVSEDGSISSSPLNMVASVFLNFIPMCRTEGSLVKFYTSNKTAITILSERMPDAFAQVVDAFSKRKAEIMAELKSQEPKGEE